MLAVLNDLIEQRINQARDDGQFDQLPGAGRPKTRWCRKKFEWPIGCSRTPVSCPPK